MEVALIYLVLGGAYLTIVPFSLFFYLQARQHVASSIERTAMYFLVFLFFPGMLLLAPFINFRPQKRKIAT